MSAQPDVAELRKPTPAVARADRSPTGTGVLDAALIQALLAALPGDGPAWIARAPRRLEVMGGSAAFMGSLVLTMPLAESVAVAARPQHDRQLSLIVTSPGERNGRAPIVLPLAGLPASAAVAELSRLAEPDAGSQDGALRAVARALIEAERFGLPLKETGGLALAIQGPTLSEGSAPDMIGSAVAAAMAASAGACGAGEPRVGSASSSDRSREYGEWSLSGDEDLDCPLHGVPDAIRLYRPGLGSAPEFLALPEGLTLIGVDSGHWPDDRAAKHRRYRTTARMGRFLVDRMIRHDGDGSWDGMLAHIAVDDYVQRFRDRIPTKMTGRDFLARFADAESEWTEVDSQETYKLRSRTEHPIYEHTRAGAFADALRRFSRTRDAAYLREAGELMYSSHWSYGQRCGLGSIPTDLLVNLIRRHGADSGIVGAKISGLGGGGVVCVLAEKSDAAEVALDRAVHDYASRSRLSPRVWRGSSAGALVTGVLRVGS